MGVPRWNLALEAILNNESLYKDEILRSTAEVLLLKDKFPKAKIHWLALPKTSHLDSVSDLQKVDIPLLEAMKNLAIDELNLAFPQLTPDSIMLGFHAIPSMKHLHMHIISKDFNSPLLKKKAHWNSFNTAFFISLDRVIWELQYKNRVDFNRTHMALLLNQPLKCPHCLETFTTLPLLKSHLSMHE